MDESLWELFWTTGLPEAYALAKRVEDPTAAGAEYEKEGSLRVTNSFRQGLSGTAGQQ